MDRQFYVMQAKWYGQRVMRLGLIRLTGDVNLCQTVKKVPHHRNWTKIQYISVSMFTIHSHSIMWPVVLISVNYAHNSYVHIVCHWTGQRFSYIVEVKRV